MTAFEFFGVVRAGMAKALDESMDLIGKMLCSVCEQLSIESAAAYVTNEPLDLTADKLVQREVQKRLSEFNHLTLHTVKTLVAVPAVEANDEMRMILEKLRDEIIKQAGETLPKGMQQLDTLLGIAGADERAAWIQVRC